jgi:hypothetical protein
LLSIAEEYGANAQADSEKIDEENTLGGTPKHPGHSMMQVIVTNILDPFTEGPGLSLDYPEHGDMGHVKDEYPENQQRRKD